MDLIDVLYISRRALDEANLCPLIREEKLNSVAISP
jgi:hypothetical protein